MPGVIYAAAMSPMGLRLLAVPLGLLAFALMAMVTFWVLPATADLDFVPSMLLFIAAGVGAIGVPTTILELIASGHRRRPRGFDLAPGAFAVLPAARERSTAFIGVIGVTGNGVVRELDGHTIWLGTSTAAKSVLLMLIAAVWAIALVMLFRQRSLVSLDRLGFHIPQSGYTSTVGWDDIAVNGRPDNRIRRVTIYRRLPDGTLLQRERFRVKGLHIDPAFLVFAIRHYAGYPEHRAAIGSAGELIRLQTAYADWTAAGSP